MASNSVPLPLSVQSEIFEPNKEKRCRCNKYQCDSDDQEGRYTFKLWENVPIPTLIYVYIFNYTNVEAALAGLEKPKVVEVGPYVYKEQLSRVNIIDNLNYTWSYQESRRHEFVPELSNGDPVDDIVLVPNIPLITALAQPKAGGIKSFFGSVAVKMLQRGFQPEPFQALTAYDFTWNYGDVFGSVSKTLATLTRRPTPKRLGILAQRDGLNPDVRTIWSGLGDLKRVNLLSRFNGQSGIGLWDSEVCDSFDKATDGTIFPPKGFTKNTTLYIYVKDFCRTIPLSYKEDITTDKGYPAYRFVYRHDTFATPEENPVNSCYCNGTDCWPSGAFSVSKCSYGAPLVASFPHFLYGDKSLLENVDGLNPDPEKHFGYMDVHTTLGLPINGNSRFQIGIRVHSSNNNPTYKGIPNGTILPMSWLDFKIGGLSDNLDSVLYHYTFTAYNGKMALRWGCPAGIVISSIIFLYLITKYFKNKKA